MSSDRNTYTNVTLHIINSDDKCLLIVTDIHRCFTPHNKSEWKMSRDGNRYMYTDFSIHIINQNEKCLRMGKREGGDHLFRFTIAVCLRTNSYSYPNKYPFMITMVMKAVRHQEWEKMISTHWYWIYKKQFNMKQNFHFIFISFQCKKALCNMNFLIIMVMKTVRHQEW